MRNLPESRHAPKLRDSQFDRLDAVSHGKGEYAPHAARFGGGAGQMGSNDLPPYAPSPAQGKPLGCVARHTPRPPPPHRLLRASPAVPPAGCGRLAGLLHRPGRPRLPGTVTRAPCHRGPPPGTVTRVPSAAKPPAPLRTPPPARRRPPASRPSGSQRQVTPWADRSAPRWGRDRGSTASVRPASSSRPGSWARRAASAHQAAVSADGVPAASDRPRPWGARPAASTPPGSPSRPCRRSWSRLRRRRAPYRPCPSGPGRRTRPARPRRRRVRPRHHAAAATSRGQARRRRRSRSHSRRRPQAPLRWRTRRHNGRGRTTGARGHLRGHRTRFPCPTPQAPQGTRPAPLPGPAVRPCRKPSRARRDSSDTA
ncbi:hypothetical protein SAMN05444921_11027 [Streptomyces wuyuanensis]|uniref:Uncharacterized protein n=1 Tax=Streptomyces wuyuanensis TaxID=1196353 RepID=A0A1G9U9W8_9ACTN|nr:hypothetical protein SAMN05444921_11027 [Streptomyces wuyuanensis]